MRLDSMRCCDTLPLSFAPLAVFRFVDEASVPKECLFSRRKHKRQAATYTQDITVSKRHNSPPTQQIQTRDQVGGGSPSVKNALRVGHLIPINPEKYVRYLTKLGVFFVSRELQENPSTVKGLSNSGAR